MPHMATKMGFFPEARAVGQDDNVRIHQGRYKSEPRANSSFEQRLNRWGGLLLSMLLAIGCSSGDQSVANGMSDDLTTAARVGGSAAPPAVELSPSSTPTSLPPVPDVVSESSVALEPIIAGADVALMLSDVVVDDPQVHGARPHVSYQTFTASVVAVLAKADVSGLAVLQGHDESYKPPDAGDIFRGFSEVFRSEDDPLRLTDIGRLVDSADTGRLVVLAHHVGSNPNSPAGWVVSLAAVDDGAGNLSFGPQMGDLFAGALPAVRSAAVAYGATYRSDVETLVAWVDELTSVRRPGEGFPEISAATGHLSAAWRAVVDRSTPNVGDLWRNADPSIRALDPEITPPEVFGRLLERPLLVDISEDAMGALSGYDLVIRSSTGVTHLAQVMSGNHPGQFFALPGETVEVVLTEDFLTGEGVVVGSIEFSEWKDAAGIVVELRPSLTSIIDKTADTAGYDVIVGVDMATFESWVADFAATDQG